MNRLLSFIMFLLCFAGTANATEYVLSGSTATSTSGGSSPFTFSTNSQTIYVENSSNKLYNAASGTNYVKYSSNVQYTVSGIPSGETITSVTFSGFPNTSDGSASYISEFNGTTYTASASPAVFTNGTAAALLLTHSAI